MSSEKIKTMDIRHLRYFVCLAEELHFGRAAEKLHIAQPALSIQIKNLEDFFGGQLFERNKRNVTLTDAGKSILSKSRGLLREMEELVEFSDMLFRGHAGYINISYSGLAAYSRIMGDVIKAFKDKYPGVRVNLEENDPHTQLECLKESRIHVAFMTTMGLIIPNDVHAEFLTSYPLRYILPSEHKLVDKNYISVEDLNDERFVIYAAPGDERATAVIEKVCGFIPEISHRASSALLLPSLVSAGLGIALIPSAFDSIAEERGTKIVPLPKSAPEMDISFLFLDKNISPIVKNFIEILRAHQKPL